MRVKCGVGHADFFRPDRYKASLAYRAAIASIFAAGTRYFTLVAKAGNAAADRDYTRITRSVRRYASPAASGVEQRFQRHIIALCQRPLFAIGVIHLQMMKN